MYPILSKPGTPYSRNQVPLAQNHVSFTLETMPIEKKFDKKLE